MSVALPATSHNARAKPRAAASRADTCMSSPHRTRPDPTDRPDLSWQEVSDAQHELGLTRPTDRPDLSWQEVPDAQHELGLTRPTDLI